MLFSATLDGDVNVIVRKYLNKPLTFDVDPADGDPHADIDHHVLRINSGDRVAVIAGLAKPGGRTVVFTRTRHGATKLSEQLNKAGIPAVDLHGMLSQSARATQPRQVQQWTVHDARCYRRRRARHSRRRCGACYSRRSTGRTQGVSASFWQDRPRWGKGHSRDAGDWGTGEGSAPTDDQGEDQANRSHVQRGTCCSGRWLPNRSSAATAKPQSQTEKPEQRSRDGWARSKSSRPNRKPTGNRRQRPGSDRSRTPAKAS